MASKPALSTTAKKNLDTIALIEQRMLEQQSGFDRFGASIARFFGSLRFIAAHFLVILGWVLVNTKLISGVQPFDPYPFAFLSVAIGIEFIFLTTFVLMNQKDQMRWTEQWAHLNLQLCILAEQEGTKNMQMLHQICQHLGLESAQQDREVKDLIRTTPVTILAEEIGKTREVKAVGQELVEENKEIREATKELAQTTTEVRHDSVPQPLP